MLKEEQIDVRGGRCTYGQMVELGRILDAADKRTEYSIREALIAVLHPDEPDRHTPANKRYALEIAEGVRFWREREAKMLKYDPTDDERAAGYEQMAASAGATGVAITIAEKFGVSIGPDGRRGPDDVFNWPYCTVFAVLLHDLERAKFQRRLDEVRERKRKTAAKSAKR